MLKYLTQNISNFYAFISFSLGEIDEESYAGFKTQNAYLEPSHINNFKKVPINAVF